MDALRQELALDERALARELWDALMLSSSPKKLGAARERLKVAPHRVQEAVMNVIAPLMIRELAVHPDENPFEKPGG